ncbi:MAG: efflux RND transporter periplasmic adaptor subunit [Candidatus Saganbacteria bacterium]|nr:efflux RND transporter periplasmic adaptor subunit [Candidatus Saganbacteria bacterium]
MNIKRIIILIAAVIFISILLSASWFYFLKRPPKDIIATGTIEATEANVGSKIAGRILEIRVKEGDTVKKGTVLATLDVPEITARLREAEAGVSAARSQLTTVKLDYIRIKELHNKGVISRRNYDEAKGALGVAEAALLQAKAAREVANVAVSESIVKAPITGTVTLKAAEVGELVDSKATIVTLADLGKIYLTVYVSEKDVGKVKLGQIVEVKIDSYPKERFIGKIIYISEQAEFTPKNIQTKEERVTQVFGVKIEVPNPELKLKPGLPADAIIKAH